MAQERHAALNAEVLHHLTQRLILHVRTGPGGTIALMDLPDQLAFTFEGGGVFEEQAAEAVITGVRVLGGGKNMMLGNLIELQFGQGRNWPLGSALSITLMAIVMLALLVYVRNTSKSGGMGHG